MLTIDDRLQIGEPLSSCGHIIDGGQLDRLPEVFTPEIVYDLSDAGLGAFEGVEAIRAASIALGARNPIAHHVTDVVISDATPGEATVRSKGLVIMADGKLSSVSHLDTVSRQDGRWRISRRIVTAQRGRGERES